ncbi:MAG: dihydroorotate dehydrogenase [Defluviitaleaceae bacterium]|nr:dihydroorotate dehydrogenase [Defluviitaleaceae bacterium]MCL2262595.1 dihydroorotate dehydrogenase [Defluviitaleaceae bacterium]
MSNLSVNIAGVELKSPIVTASGTFGSGKEYAQFIDLNRLGAITVKGVSHEPWQGNPPPRIAETHGGMLNAVGLQNPGAKEFIEKDLPFLKKFDTKIIVNLCGRTVEDYIAVTQDFANAAIDFFELNISCPNVKAGGMAMGTDPKMAEEVTRAVKKHAANTPVIVKLSPNVTDIVAIAKGAEAGGADGLCLINTLLGMKIDIYKKKPILGNKVGGLSGPAIKPVAVRMVYQVAKAVNLPIIGTGGAATWQDAIEFIMAGATAVSVGTANFSNPCATMEMLDGIAAYMENNNIKNLSEIRGIIE